MSDKLGTDAELVRELHVLRRRIQRLQAAYRCSPHAADLPDDLNDYHGFWQFSPVPLQSLDACGRILDVNPRWCDRTGYRREEVLGKDFGDLLNAASRQRFALDLDRCMADGYMQGRRYVLFCKDNSSTPVLCDAQMAYDADGRHVQAYCAVRFVTADETQPTLPEESYRNMVENLNDLVVKTDSAKRILYASPRYCEVFGKTESELVGKAFMPLVHPDDRPQVEASFVELHSGCLAASHEERAMTTDGYRWFAWSLRAVAKTDGSVSEVVAMGRDITDRRRAEEAYRAVVDYSLQGLIILQDRRVVFANPAFCRMLGYQYDEVLDMSVEDVVASLVHPEDASTVLERYGRRVTGKDVPASYEVRSIHKDGSIHWLELSVALIEYRGRQATQAACIDITGRRQAEQALKENEQKYRTLVEGSIQGTIIAQADPLRLGFVSSVFAELTGYGREELRNAGPDELLRIVHPDDRETLFSSFQRRIAGEPAPREYEIRIIRADGAMRWMRLFSTRISYMGGPATLSVVVDVTNRKQAELLLQAQLDLAQELAAATDLDNALDRCVDAAIECAAMDSGGIYLIDPDTGAMDLACWRGLSPQFAELVSHHDGDAAEARVVAEGCCVYSKYEELGLSLNDTERAEGLLAFGSVPVFHDDRIVACLVVSSHTKDEVPGDRRPAVETIAAQMGGAIARLRAEQALCRREQEFRAIADYARDLECWIGPDGRVRWVNPSAERVTGYTAEELMAMSHFPAPLIEEKDKCKILATFEEAVKGSAGNDFRWRLRTKDGQLKWMSTSWQPIYAADGACLGHRSSHRDISRRVRMEEQLDVLVGNLPGMAYHCTNASDWPMTYVSPGCRELTGYEPGDITSGRTSYGHIIHRDDRQKVWGAVQDAINNGEAFELEYRILTKDRQEKWVWERGRAVKCEEGREVHLEGFVTDVTARVRAERQTDLQALVLDQIEDQVAITDVAGHLVYVNKALIEQAGCSRDELMGRHITVFDEDSGWQVAQQEIYQKTLQHGRWQQEVVHHEVGGRRMIVDLRTMIVYDKQNKPVALCGIGCNITERKEYEAKLSDYQSRLRALASALTLAEERERHRIATGLHDDACQDLVLAKMKLQGLQQALSKPNAQEITSICNDLDSVVNGLRELIFDLSSPTLHRFGLEAAMEELADHMLSKHGIRCRLYVDGVAKPLAEDVRTLLFRSVRELFVNIIKHAEAESVSLDIVRSEDTIRIVVADDGVGFNTNELLGDMSQSRGFGLFSIKQRLEHIGGRMETYSRPGQGSRFAIVAGLKRE